MRGDDDDDSGWRPVLLGLGALAGVSLLVGGLVAIVALGVVGVTGLGGSSASGPSVAPSLYMPPLNATTGTPDPSGPASSSPAVPVPSTTQTTRPRRKTKRITLTAYPRNVRPSERINLTGVYPRAEGASLQVQRFEHGWVDFPTRATVRGGIFATYVLTGRSGDSRFRMYDAAAGRASNPVTVTVG